MTSGSVQSPAAPASAQANWEEVLALARKVGGQFEVQVHGRSMGDALPDGSNVRIRVAGGAASPEYAEGEVALYWSAERKQLVAHRIVKGGRDFRRQRYVITRGDVCVLCDAPMNPDEMIGTVSQLCREGSWQPVPPPVSLVFWRRVLAGVGVTVARCWGYCSTPVLRRRLTAVMWLLRGHSMTP